MKKQIRSLLCLMLSLLLLTGMLSGCASGNSTSSDVSASSQKTEASASEDSSTPESGDTAKNDEQIELTVFIDHTWYDTDKFEGIIPEEITKQTNVVLKPTKAVDSMQLGVIIASDEAYDMIYTSQLGDRLSNSNICYAYNELIEQYAPNFQPSDDQMGLLWARVQLMSRICLSK